MAFGQANSKNRRKQKRDGWHAAGQYSENRRKLKPGYSTRTLANAVIECKRGCRYFAECGLRNAERCQGVICGKSSVERSANYPLLLFRIPQPKNSAFPRMAKLPFARIAQQMCNWCIQSHGPLKNEKWFIGYSSSMLDCTSNKTLTQEHTVQNYNTPDTIYSNLADLRLTMWNFSNRRHDLALI